MPESPPKRITRARARAAEKEPDAKSVKVAASKTTRTTKRKTRADDAEDQAVAIDIPETTADKPAPAKATKGRAKKVAVATVEPVQEIVVAEPMPSQADEPEPPKTTRGRTRKVAASKAKPAEKSEKLDTAKAKRAPRGRAASAAVASAAAAAAAAAAVTTVAKEETKPAGAKKKVTFQDDLDKENILPPSDEFKQPSPKKFPGKATGLRAKPVRRPAAGRATRSTKKAAATEVEKPEEKAELPPLSPKKAKQIPMVQPPSEDDDELSGGKTPRKRFMKSPGADQTLATMGGKDISKLNFSSSLVALRQDSISTADLLSSSKAFGSSLLGTPARRPPSPTKDMTREPSPKKIHAGNSVRRPFLAAPASTLNDSLLQSPAKRPIHAPVKKGETPGSPRKSVPATASGLDLIGVSFETAEIKASMSSPPKNTSRATKPSERPAKLHKISIDEQFEQEDIVQKSPTPLISAIELNPDERKSPVKPIAWKLPVKPIREPSPLKASAPTSRNDSAMEVDDHHISEPIAVEESEHVERSTTPPGLPAQTPIKAFSAKMPTAACQGGRDSDSEDELQSRSQDHLPTPLIGSHRVSTKKKLGVSSIPTPSAIPRRSKGTPIHNVTEVNATTGTAPTPSPTAPVQPARIFSMTPLASQFGNLAVTSPDKVLEEQAQPQRGLFSPLPPKPRPSSVDSLTQYSPPKSSFFDDEMLVLEQQEGEVEEEPIAPTEISEASQEYGDENVIPIDPRLLTISQSPPAACTPARVFTVVPQEIYTVQRVPLKPAADDLPNEPELKRNTFLSGPNSPRKEFLTSTPGRNDEVPSVTRGGITPDRQSNIPVLQDFCTPVKPAPSPQRTPGTVGWSNICSPARTPRRYVNPETLKGAVVYVDVHTAEGADASGIFVELLTQMGARCVKQWNWNPSGNANTVGDSGFGIGGTDEGIRDAGPVSTPGGTTPGSKIGITHVVFKDGGVRTLQKIRESKGVVLCVGVNWVLDCEREQRWLDEADYAVDPSIIPRGGHRRRKSMEPRALANINGNLVPCDTPVSGKDMATATTARTSFSPTKEFLTFSSPASRRDTLVGVPTTPQQQLQHRHPGMDNDDNCKEDYGDDDMSLSPTTPYFLHPSEITQRTCPPKPMLLFSHDALEGSGIVRQREDEGLKQRLLLARRKSLQWAPKVGSPLGRGVSFGE
ncbi:hypothetical protein GP486_006029 [Trichoglossum hirsutum]|uniref:BRCT domain-containing protein n=1 Tax=Trichoglossum hirsutum TaxID=265104 RepID=A0A9P8L848_9PEZI|nr:hypothetical protein GP486_006029 [Trichoglossum hirsutum]